MMRSILTIVSGILFLLSGAAIADTVVIPADEPSWTDTGVLLGPLDGVTIHANGLACYDTADDCQNGDAWTGPDGIEEVADETFVVPGLNKYALVGKIGDGDPFLVGSYSNVDCEQETGTLLLIHNDSDSSDNSGSYEVNIQVTTCESLCTGSTVAPTHQESPLYGTSDLAKHLGYFFLPVGVVIAVAIWRRRR
jgi:hypothetical protein